jgi:hypothetical protein
MTPDPNTPPPHDDSAPLPDLSRLSARTTPTWEMELLVSGATVFGLLQLPPVADRFLFALYNTASPAVAGMVMPLWVYVKFILLTLSGTFIAHLALRGYWVALTGLASVYPAGIRWEKLAERSGPLYMDASRRQLGDMAAVIERADNRATRVFGIGFGLAMMMLLPIVLVLVLLVLLWLWSLFGEPGDTGLIAALGLFLVFTMAFGLVVLWDRRRGAKAAPGGLEGRSLRAALNFYLGMGFSRTNNPLMTLFASNESGSRTTMVMTGLMFVGFIIISLPVVGERLGWSLGDYAGLPPDRRAIAETVLPEHYASQRGDAPRLRPAPWIPDPVVRGDYVRLFIPYFPQRHNAAMQRECPQALAADAEKAARDRLDCLARIHAIAIDGVPVDVPFDAAEDPRFDQRGLLAMIPVHDLAIGRHELTVLPALRDRELEPGAKPVTPYIIPFWR